MTLLDYNGNPLKLPVQFSAGDPPVLDKDGHVVNQSTAGKVWAKALLREVERGSFFEEFIGTFLYDEFGYKLKYIREGKGNVIELVTGQTDGLREV